MHTFRKSRPTDFRKKHILWILAADRFSEKHILWILADDRFSEKAFCEFWPTTDFRKKHFVNFGQIFFFNKFFLLPIFFCYQFFFCWTFFVVDIFCYQLFLLKRFMYTFFVPRWHIPFNFPHEVFCKVVVITEILSYCIQLCSSLLVPRQVWTKLSGECL